MSHIAIFDCAIKRPSSVCFNRLVSQLNVPFTYHRPPNDGLSSAAQDTGAMAYIIFGSASNVEDRLDWHASLSQFCFERLKEDKAVLGLCFGHQLMADFFGLTVSRNSDHKSHYGSRKIVFTEGFGHFNKGEEARVFKAHSFEVTGELKELELLASSSECLYDGLYHPKLPYWGFQGHPEASRDFYDHEIVDHDITLKDTEIDQALHDGLMIIKSFCQGAQKD